MDKKTLDRLLTLYEPVVNADTTIHYKEHFDVYDRTLDVRAFPLKDDLFILSFMDITGHIETGQALRESNERHQDLLNAINSGVAVYKVINDGQSGSDYIIQDFNRVSLELEGMTKEEVVGKNLFDLRPTIDEYGLIPVFRKVWKTGEPAFFPAKVYVDEKYANYYENRVFRLLSGEIVAVYDDVTERKRMEEEKHSMQAQLQQAQKLESIGTLASGVAHEINNPVMGVINYADLIHEHEKDETLKEYAQNIMDEGTRIARIVKSLLSFSRQDSDEHSTARIADIINGSLSLTSAALRKDQITLKVEIPDDLPRITCHTQQIQQVILNLITNAQFTLNERYTGYDENKLLAITVSEFEDEGRKWQRVTVEDHGTGIPEDFLERIFDPFFTTKCRSEGTGLGLSVSYGIMKEHGGKLSVECESGKYTRFHIDLPVGLEERKGSGSA